MLSDGGEGSIAGVLDPLSYPLLPAVSCCLSSKSWLAPSPFSPSVSRALSPLLAPAQLSTLPSLATAIDSGQAGRSMASCRRGARFAAANRTGVAPRCPVSYGRKWRAARSRTRRIPSPAPAPACTSPAPRPRQHCTDLCDPPRLTLCPPPPTSCPSPNTPHPRTTRRIPALAPAPACTRTSPAPRPRHHCTDRCRPASPSARLRSPPAPAPTRGEGTACVPSLPCRRLVARSTCIRICPGSVRPWRV